MPVKLTLALITAVMSMGITAHALEVDPCRPYFEGVGVSPDRSTPALLKAEKVRLEYVNLFKVLEDTAGDLREYLFDRLQGLLQSRAKLNSITNHYAPLVRRETIVALRDWKIKMSGRDPLEISANQKNLFRRIVMKDPYFQWLLEASDRAPSNSNLREDPFFSSAYGNSAKDPIDVLRFHLSAKPDSVNDLSPEVALVRVQLDFDPSFVLGTKESKLSYDILKNELTIQAMKKYVTIGDPTNPIWRVVSRETPPEVFKELLDGMLRQYTTQTPFSYKGHYFRLPALDRIVNEAAHYYENRFPQDKFHQAQGLRQSKDFMEVALIDLQHPGKGDPKELRHQAESIAILKMKLGLDDDFPTTDLVKAAKTIIQNPAFISYGAFAIKAFVDPQNPGPFDRRLALFNSLLELQHIYTHLSNGMPIYTIRDDLQPTY